MCERGLAAAPLSHVYSSRKSMTPELGHSLPPELRQFAAADLLSGVGALQLFPENAAHGVRLEQLAHICCAAEGSRACTPNEFYRLWPVLAALLEQLASLEDPQESRFVEEVGYLDRVYRVLSGIAHESSFIGQHVLDAAIEAGPTPEEDSLLRAGLSLSDAICRTADLDRRSGADSHPHQDIGL